MELVTLNWSFADTLMVMISTYFEYHHTVPASCADREDFPLSFRNCPNVFDCPASPLSPVTIHLDTEFVQHSEHISVLKYLHDANMTQTTLCNTLDAELREAIVLCENTDESLKLMNDAEAIAVVARLKSTALSILSSCKGLKDFICSKMDTDQKSVVAQELTFNVLLSQIKGYAEEMGYVAVGNVKNALVTGNNPFSRFHTSRPDNFFVNKHQHCGYVVLDEGDLEEKLVLDERDCDTSDDDDDDVIHHRCDKLPIATPLHQLLGSMEKLAGNLAYFHLKNCSTEFRSIKVYGLIICSQNKTSRGYSLIIDFKKRTSVCFEDISESDLNSGVSKLLRHMKFSANKAEHSS